MAMSESWYGETLERKYLIDMSFDDPEAWTDDCGVSFPGDWKMLHLPDLMDIFYVRILLTGTPQAPWHQVVLKKLPTGDKFGECPLVWIRLRIEHQGEIVYQDDHEHVTWYPDIPMPDKPVPNHIKDHSRDEGYQEHSIPMAILLKNESFQKRPSFDLTIEIRIRTKTGEDPNKPGESNAEKSVLRLAKLLREPLGDIEFVFVEEDGSFDDHTPRLYGLSAILEDTGFDDSRLTHAVVSIPSSPGGDRPLTPPPSPTSLGPSSPIGRRVLFIQEDYELFHMVLIYLYTSRISFTTSSSPFPSHAATTFQIPSTSDAEGIYAIAHRLGLEPLKAAAFHFLKSTTDLDNISERTFGEFACEHVSVGKWYDEWFLKRFAEIKMLQKFEDVFVSRRRDWQEYDRVSTKYRKMIRSL